MAAALDDIRVLDLSTSMAGAWCSRLLADFGADVVMVEPPDGHPLRRLAPFDRDGAGIPARYVQANKRSALLDHRASTDRDALRALAAACDVVVESDGPGALQRWGLDYDALERARPDAVLVSVTANGLSGARAGRPGNDLTAYARSGWASINGLRDREPLKGSGFIASYLAGVAAHGAAVTALLYRDLHGEGQHIDVAETETLLEIFSAATLVGQYRGAPPQRRATIDLFQTFPVPVRDGHLALTVGRGERWRDAMIALDLADVADDERYASLESRIERREEFAALVQAKLAEWDKMDLFDALASLRVIAGPVLGVDELHDNAHLRARGYFVRPPDAPNGPEYPGAPVRMTATPWALRRAQPAPGEHTIEVLRELAGHDAPRPDTRLGVPEGAER